MKVADLTHAPYVRIYSWMGSQLKLKGNELTAFALIFERDVLGSESVEALRIDGAYIARACGIQPTEIFQILSSLERKHLLRVEFGEDGMSTYFKVDEEAVAAAVEQAGGLE